MWHLLTAHQQESFLPFSSRPSLSCCLSRVAKRSTPKPRGPLRSFRTLWSFSPFQNCVVLFLSLQNRMVLSSLHQSCLILSLLLQNLMVLSFPSSEPRGPLSIYLLQNLVVLPFTSEPCGLLSIYFGATWSTPSFRAAWSPPFSPKTLWSSPLLWLPGLGFKSQFPSSFAAHF